MELTTSFSVARPIGDVFGAWMDLERAPEWAGPVIERRKLTPGPPGVGTKYLARDRFPGKVLEFTVEITELDPPHLVAATWDGVMGGGWTARFNEAASDETIVGLEAQMVPQGWLKLMTPVISGFARKAIDKDMTSFKSWVESGAALGEDEA